MRRPIVAANWKMHHTVGEAQRYLHRLLELVPADPPLDLVVLPSATSIQATAQSLAQTPIAWGAQSARPEPEGPFTGELSVRQVCELGASYVICGHSERRALFNEDDKLVSRMVKAALESDLVPIMCVGESLEQRRAGTDWQVGEKQLDVGLSQIEEQESARIVIAYEPVWAIGTGVAAQPEDAQQMAGRIRTWLGNRFGASGERIRIQYGGSVKPDNAQQFLELANVDGALVGGASLDPDSFWQIAQAAVR